MSDSSLVHLLPYSLYRMDQIDPCWATKGAFIDLDPQEDRMPFMQWQKWVNQRVFIVRKALNAERFNIDRLEGQDRKDYERFNNEDTFLNELLAVLSLPPDVVAGARKRIFGDFAPVDTRGGILFSHEELTLIAGALWPASKHRMQYVQLKCQAEATSKCAKRVADVFVSLRNEIQ